MIESNTIVLKKLHLQLVIIIIVSMLVPHIFGTFKDLILVRKALWDDSVEDNDKVDTEFTSIII